MVPPLGLALALLLGAVMMALTLPGRTAAAADITSKLTFTDVKITNSSGSTTIESWQEARLHANWSIPASTTVAAGDSFSLVLDPNGPVRLIQDITFPLTTDPSDPNAPTVGTCTGLRATGGVTCTFNDYYTTHTVGRNGTIYVGLRQEATTVGGHTTTVTIDGEATTIPYEVKQGTPFAGLEYGKDGLIQDDGTVEW
ncbi:hypothetical protein HJ590_09025 [Naumannella sp. ID2617S]|nr:hypothetical protein [Naumannella sp. ID2617S]